MFGWLINWWNAYQEQRKHDAIMARMRRNADGRFSQKEHLKAIHKQVKTQREKNRNAQEDSK